MPPLVLGPSRRRSALPFAYHDSVIAALEEDMLMTDTTASLHAKLLHSAGALAQTRIETLFEREPDRLQRLSLEAAGLSLDASKNLLDQATERTLLALAASRALPEATAAMFNGEVINQSEHRAVLHTALRALPGAPASPPEAVSAVADVLTAMGKLVHALHDGSWTGATGKRILDVVNIGIGGSYLGPQLACDALRDFATGGLRLHFLANVDGAEFERVVAPLNPETTLFIVASKSFSTTETRLNALSARAWLCQHSAAPDAVSRHFVAVSASPARAVEFGIAADNVYPMWDWVGGRYSLWSAIGLPIACAIGMAGFHGLLAGARAMDEHFLAAPLARNMPVLLALVGLWNNNYLGADSYAVVPYDDRLRYLPEYLQQLEMESNGKQRTMTNQPVVPDTAPITWGGLGTNAQHAFFQLLHQGTRLVPVDFVVCLRSGGYRREHHDTLVANCLAQAEGLMRGRQLQPDTADAPQRATPGNRPSNMLVLPELTPATLGALLALYEHKTFVQAHLWGINAFDQWGVELGKQLAEVIQSEIAAGRAGAPHDASTTALLARYLAARAP